VQFYLHRLCPIGIFHLPEEGDKESEEVELFILREVHLKMQ